jgi:hypothetical protein
MVGGFDNDDDADNHPPILTVQLTFLLTTGTNLTAKKE